MEADALSNLGSSREMKGPDSGTVVQLLHSVLDVDGYCEVNLTNLIWDWRNEFIEYLRHGKLPDDTKLVHQPVELLHSVLSSWSFMKWRMDIVGPVLSALGKVEAGPYQKIVEREVVDFIWDHIICRFGIPKEIACDNRPQFIGSKVTKFLEGLKIKRITSSPYHPSANVRAESTNKVIIQNLKKKLEDAKGKWPDELSGVLWAYRTMTKSSTRETPFSIVYGSEALILVEVGEPTLRFS
nr:uncharacterized protein LOC108943786 [Nicotiana tomentosiformis]